MTIPLLQIDKLVVGYGKDNVLQGVSLTLVEGAITCLFGPNGAGKSTLMKTIVGLLRPRSGTIRFAGKELKKQSPHNMLAQGIALVPEQQWVFPTMSVHDNLRIGAYRRHRHEIEADLARIYVRFPRLKERARQNAGTLSGGEKKMLALARALMSQPTLLLLDEPSLGLAPRVVDEIFHMIDEINAQGTSILLVEQNRRMALKVAHHGYLMEQGRVHSSSVSQWMPRTTADLKRHDTAMAEEH